MKSLVRLHITRLDSLDEEKIKKREDESGLGKKQTYAWQVDDKTRLWFCMHAGPEVID